MLDFMYCTTKSETDRQQIDRSSLIHYPLPFCLPSIAAHAPTLCFRQYVIRIAHNLVKGYPAYTNQRCTLHVT